MQGVQFLSESQGLTLRRERVGGNWVYTSEALSSASCNDMERGRVRSEDTYAVGSMVVGE